MTTRTEALEESGIAWWLILIEGIALLILGGLFLANPLKTSLIAAQVLGIYWIIAGIFKIISIFMDNSQWGLKLLAGILGIAAGIIILNHVLAAPALLAVSIVLIMGIQGIIFGIIGIVQALRGAGWGTGVLGIVSLLFGILLIGNYLKFAFSLPWAIGILCIVGGIAAIVMAFRVR